MRALIHRFKYQADLDLGRALGRVMAQQVDRYPILKKYQKIIPIPLHPEAANRRTFNQALILADQVADVTKGRVYPDVLLRLPGSALQHTLGRRQRKQGLAGEFFLARPELVGGQKILLIDDILTTGNTLSQAARVLLRGGATEVAAFTLAIGITVQDGY